MKIKTISLLVFSVVLPLYMSAHTSVERVSINAKKSGNITYSLPKTELLIEVSASQTIYKPGPFYQYAERYLAVSDAIESEKTEWTISRIKVTPRAVVDENRTYQVKLSKKGVSNNISLTESGLIRGVNIDRKELGNDNEKLHFHTIYTQQDTSISFDLSVLDAEALQSSSISKMAEMAAKQIFNLREARNALLTLENEVLPDGTATKIILEQITRKEEDLVSLFVGKSLTQRQTRTYLYEPTEDGKFVFARFSTLKGLLDEDDLLGSPLYITIKGEYEKAADMSKKELKKEKKAIKGFFYNVPGRARVEISSNGELLLTKRVTVPQFGYTQWIAPDITDSEKASLLYDTKSGVIINIVH